MLNFSVRSQQLELLDEATKPIATQDLHKNLKELDFINTYLGGHKINESALRQLWTMARKPPTLLIAEIGCGGGDNLRALHQYCKRKKINAQFIGIDLKKDCISYAENNNNFGKVHYVQSAYQEYTFQQKPDIIFSSLFCHHFSEVAIREQLVWMQQNAKIGFFINDLERNKFAYISIKLLTKLFSKSYLVKHDAPLSVARAYTKLEWEKLIINVGLIAAKVQWKWAFRYLIVNKNGGK